MQSADLRQLGAARAGAVAALLAWLTLWAAVAPTAAQELQAAGDGTDTWLLRPDLVVSTGSATTFIVWYRNVLDEPGRMRSGVTLTGTVLPGGVAAAEGTLYVVYDNLSLQSLSFPDSMVAGRYVQEAPHNEKALPQGLVLRGLAAGRDGPWALVKVTTPEALKAIDEPGMKPRPGDADTRNDAGTGQGEEPAQRKDASEDDAPPPASDIGSNAQPPAESPPDPADDASDKPADAPGKPDETAARPLLAAPTAAKPGHAEAESATPDRQAVGEDRLLRLFRNDWVRVALPDDWPHGSPCWLVMRYTFDPAPALAVLAPGEADEQALWLYEYEVAPAAARASRRANGSNTAVDAPAAARDGQAPAAGHPSTAKPADTPLPAGRWTKRQYDIAWSQPAPRRLVVLSIENQILLAEATTTQTGREVALIALRPGGAVPLEERLVVQATVPDGRWTVAPLDRAAALYVMEDAQITATMLELSAGSAPTTIDLVQRAREPFNDAASYFILVGVLVMATMIMFAFWRRDPAWNKLELPRDMALADFSTRAIAAAIDLAPGFLGAMLIFKKSFADIVENWPWLGRFDNWESMLPAATVIGIFVGHCMLSELLRRQSLGKRIMRLYVTDLRGRRPSLVAVLVRNLMKALELAAPPLLIMPLIVPNRQRLGDVVARTVVVASDKPPQPKVDSRDTEADDDTDGERGQRGERDERGERR